MRSSVVLYLDPVTRAVSEHRASPDAIMLAIPRKAYTRAAARARSIADICSRYANPIREMIDVSEVLHG